MRSARSRPLPPAEPLQGDLLSIDQLADRMRVLAAQHRVERRAGSVQPLQQAVDAAERTLTATYRALTAGRPSERILPAAAEWLLDNSHITIDQVREIRQDLPAGYYRGLPKLVEGRMAGLPRMYALARAFIGHTDGRVDSEELLRCVMAYQEVATLTMGELWAAPIMLRLALLESLSRLAQQLLDGMMLRAEGDGWGEHLLGSNNPLITDRELKKLGEEHPELPGPLVVQLLHRLRDTEHDTARAIEWLESQLAAHGGIGARVRAENQEQAAGQLTAGNIITSMRAMAATSWPDWFERVSVVEQILRRDPAGDYDRGTFATRDRYRHEVERIAKGCAISEVDVAWRVIRRCTAKDGGPRLRRRGHVGYYLVGGGRIPFEQALDYRPAPMERLRNRIVRSPMVAYASATVSLGAAVTAAGIAAVGSRGKRSRLLATVALLSPATEAAIQIVNWSVARILPPRVLPRLDLDKGIPDELRTIVVIPLLLLTEASIDGQFDRLEVLYLGNADPNLHFALLSDFADAPAAIMPDDDKLLTAARLRMDQLIAQYGDDRFLFLHRDRTWNEGEGVFMGWERKRGKLEEFIRLVEGRRDTSFGIHMGDTAILSSLRYVITLDADTQLPRDAARTMVGTLAHPLNQPELTPDGRRVVEGYGILQPRVGIDVASATRTRFARLFAGNVGIDPYTTAVSDVYQDLFGEGIFAGKGIFDPYVLAKVIGDGFPENALLSHDLLEGNYARAALLSDVELWDGFPATHGAYSARFHRWVRGDWQLAPWLRRTVPTRQGRTSNAMTAIGRWKVADNMRRSMVPPLAVGAMVAGWTVLPGGALLWTGVGLAPLLMPTALGFLDAAIHLVGRRPQQGAVAGHTHDLRMRLARLSVNTIFLLDQATVNMDAIARTVYRLTVSRRHLLEWETAEQAELRHATGPPETGRLRLLGPAAVAAAALAWRRSTLDGSVAGVVVAGWLAAPALAKWLGTSRPRAADEPVKAVDRALLYELGAQIWDYFKELVTADSHYLVPDNLQETPERKLAQRASPTNIGLQATADLVAHDLGFIGILELTDRTERLLSAVDELETWSGHLLGWYDTRTLRPLAPAYVSTADNGNLAGALLALRQGYVERRHRPFITAAHPEAMSALADLLAKQLGHDQTAMVDDLRRTIASTPATLGELGDQLSLVVNRATTLATLPGGERWGRRLVEQASSVIRDLATFLSNLDGRTRLDEVPTIAELVTRLVPIDPTQTAAEELIARHDALATRLLRRVRNMDFRPLYDQRRKVFTIGIRVDLGVRDNAFYDLLASEARLASFLAIAKGDAPQEHWFHLGRGLTGVGTELGLLSWSGTMFEYLMPRLLMRSYTETLLDETYTTAVAAQIRYGKRHHVPWGMSESAYNARDINDDYQYQAFGVPALGLKRGLDADLVVAPYATFLALPVAPVEALDNLRELIDGGFTGRYGLYEAVDYTPSRVPPGKHAVPVRSFMAHHLGMSLLAIDNFLNDDIMLRRFHSEPMVRATELLLQEQLPRFVSRHNRATPSATRAPAVTAMRMPTEREFTSPFSASPQTHVLSNGSMTTMVTTAGGGFTRTRDYGITRWSEDNTCDGLGSFCYVRDINSDAVWATTYQPTRHQLEDYRVVNALHRIDVGQHADGIGTRMSIFISPEDDVELRQITLTNQTLSGRELELTSYSEMVLGSATADAAHPAFSKLFVETEWVSECQALLVNRRPRAPGEPRRWAFHVAAIRGHSASEPEWETDRDRFIGRNGSLQEPAALRTPLSGTTGSVLDPIVSLRRRLRLVPRGTAQVTYATGVAASREEAIALAQKYHDHRAGLRARDMARSQNQIELHHLGITAEDAHRFQRLAGRALHLDPRLRASPSTIAANRLNQADLWAYGISGDRPVVLARIGQQAETALARELLQAHEYWRNLGLNVDLVIATAETSGYSQDLRDDLLRLIRGPLGGGLLDQPGGIHLLAWDTVPLEGRILLEAVARAIVDGGAGDLIEQLRGPDIDRMLPPSLPTRQPKVFPATVADRVALAGSADPTAPAALGAPTTPVAQVEEPLRLGNRHGGFSADGREFVIDIAPDRPTPAPWSNVIANEHGGCLLTERGLGYTWSANSQSQRLSPWTNDPVCDPSGEAIYLRDERSGECWSVTPQPRGSGGFRVRHGFGYSVYENRHDGIETTLTVFMGDDAAVKVCRLQVKNLAPGRRRLSTTMYVEWVLGVSRASTAAHIVTEFDARSGLLLARNPFRQDNGDRVAFLAADTTAVSVTGDRAEFIGRNSDLSRPAALRQAHLSGRVGAGHDPCGAIRQIIEVDSGDEAVVVFVLGEGADAAAAATLAERFRHGDAAATELAATQQRWRQRTGHVQVTTPSPQLDVMLNGWLLYQTLSSRVLGRTGFYQSGGAYGFRDQLQDVMALGVAAPELARQQILNNARHQFTEGDVLHWWHEPGGRGVRTHISDDYLWLVYVTDQYIRTTGDRAILDEELPFLTAPPLGEDEGDRYEAPATTEETATLYEHCVRAIEHGLRFGAHGLPLMGAGDWNDGMNLVGDEGRGESVWLGWFLLVNLRLIAGHARHRDDGARAERFTAEADRLAAAIEASGWDGEWYLRAFFDDGTPLGTAVGNECQIDSIAQSWAVISGEAPAARMTSAMAAVGERLVNERAGLIRLFTPPFDAGDLQPGYIRGYGPGIRENGGQYTHAATWVIWATTLLGDGARADRLLDLINPVSHGQQTIDRYRVEPYVMAADVYGADPHIGRGGWTWYTGAAGWTYRVGMEMILGLRREADSLLIRPCIPPDWPGFSAIFRHEDAEYHIEVDNSAGHGSRISGVWVDGVDCPDGRVPLNADGSVHAVRVVLE